MLLLCGGDLTAGVRAQANIRLRMKEPIATSVCCAAGQRFEFVQDGHLKIGVPRQRERLIAAMRDVENEPSRAALRTRESDLTNFAKFG
jgi:hypothetical protein